MTKEQEHQRLIEKFKREAVVDSTSHDLSGRIWPSIRTGHSIAQVISTEDRGLHGICHRWEILSYGFRGEFFHAVNAPDSKIIERLATLEAEHFVTHGDIREDRARNHAAHLKTA